MPIPMILDCDPGHDDVFAIWLAAGNPEIDLRAITTVGGNGQLSHTTYNARVVTGLAGITGVPMRRSARWRDRRDGCGRAGLSAGIAGSGGGCD